MGFENFLPPNSDYSDFEIFRAQQKHYDAFTSVMVEIGPGRWTFPSSRDSSPSPGSSSSSSSGDEPVVHNPSRITKGPAAGVEVVGGVISPPRSGGKLTFRESKLIDLEDVDGSFDNMELTQVMHPETTSGKFFGQTLYSNPWFSDIETWAEARYGDIGGALFAVPSIIADLYYNTDYVAQPGTYALVDAQRAEADAQRAATWRENHEALSRQWQDFNTQFPLVPEAFR